MLNYASELHGISWKHTKKTVWKWVCILVPYMSCYPKHFSLFVIFILLYKISHHWWTIVICLSSRVVKQDTWYHFPYRDIISRNPWTENIWQFKAFCFRKAVLVAFATYLDVRVAFVACLEISSMLEMRLEPPFERNMLLTAKCIYSQSSTLFIVHVHTKLNISIYNIKCQVSCQPECRVQYST